MHAYNELFIEIIMNFKLPEYVPCIMVHPMMYIHHRMLLLVLAQKFLVYAVMVTRISSMLRNV